MLSSRLPADYVRLDHSRVPVSIKNELRQPQTVPAAKFPTPRHPRRSHGAEIWTAIPVSANTHRQGGGGARQCFGAKQVMNFLGRKFHGNFEGEVVSDLPSLV